MTKRKYSWIPDKIDPRDHLFRKVVKPRLEPLPPVVDLRGGCSPVEDQGDLGSCTANALAGALEFLEIKAGKQFVDLSRLFIYFNERNFEGTPDEDSGAMIRDGVKVLHKLGVCREDIWPYDITRFTEKPDGSCYDEAIQRAIHSYDRILTLDEMKGCLADGYPFVFGFTVFSSFESLEVAQSGIVPMPADGEQEMGGHAVLCVGYDESKQMFLVRNSWGSTWGQAGYFWMPYEYLETMADDFWRINS